MKPPKNTEAYSVKFWVTNDQGFKEQRVETFKADTKHSHGKVSADCLRKYRKLGKPIDIISVSYQ